MKIYIITMDDPIQTQSFIKDIIDIRGSDIVGLAVSKGDRLTLAKGKSKMLYIISLFFIMGPFQFIKNSFNTILFKQKKKLSKYNLIANPSLLQYAIGQKIPVREIITPNSKEFRNYLNDLNIDIIINQSQSILKKELLNIAKIGVLNRHNALLPRNRGRLTPFWVLFNNESETGVSIHFVEEGLDSGNIIVQKRYNVSKNDTFNTLVAKNYKLASKAMLEAISLLEHGFNDFIYNDDDLATYNSTPSLKQALSFRLKMIRKGFL